MNLANKSGARKATKAELLRAQADALELAAAHGRSLAEIAEREDASNPTGWISQEDSPIGRRRHRSLHKKLREAGSPGVKSCGRARLIRADVFELALEDAPKRRAIPAESGPTLAERFGVR